MKFKRDITSIIEDNLNNYKMPLMIMGARQIGKTTTILNFLEIRIL